MNLFSILVPLVCIGVFWLSMHSFVSESSRAGRAEKVGFGCFVGAIIGVVGWVSYVFLTMVFDVQTPAQQGRDFARCEAELKPKLEKCLQGPQSTWGACKDAYMSDMEACTGH